MNSSSLPFCLPHDWSSVLCGELNKQYLFDLKAFLDKERLFGKSMYPKEEEIFAAFSLTPFDKVSVVIVGQDPYHGEGQAHGLSFSVRKGVAIPPSLRNIYKELHDDLAIPLPQHGCLEQWAKEGVLLLNATLTVEKDTPLSHHKRGWEQFTDACVRVLMEKKKNLVFLLWGKHAQEKVLKNPDLMQKGHCILMAAHPSPFSAKGFLGCRHFSKANAYLREHGKKMIDWTIN